MLTMLGHEPLWKALAPLAGLLTTLKQPLPKWQLGLVVSHALWAVVA